MIFISIGPIGEKVSKRYSFYSFCSLSMKLFANVFCDSCRKSYFCEFWQTQVYVFKIFEICPYIFTCAKLNTLPALRRLYIQKAIQRVNKSICYTLLSNSTVALTASLQCNDAYNNANINTLPTNSTAPGVAILTDAKAPIIPWTYTYIWHT